MAFTLPKVVKCLNLIILILLMRSTYFELQHSVKRLKSVCEQMYVICKNIEMRL